MAKYRKKPIVIEAFQRFPGMHINGVIEPDIGSIHSFRPSINTLEGNHVVSPGNFIIGIKGNEKVENATDQSPS